MPRLVAIHEGNVSFVHAPRAFGFVAQGVVNWFDSLVPKRRLVKREACLMSSCIWEIISETERYVWSQWRILFGSVRKLVLSRKGVKTLFGECVESCSLPFRIIRLVSLRMNFRIIVFIFVFVLRKSIFTENWRNIEFTYFSVRLNVMSTFRLSINQATTVVKEATEEKAFSVCASTDKRRKVYNHRSIEICIG